uniref:Uncharacterized protein n=1 Tax=Myoviridae sp. ct2cn10 TaxID=2825022 RepID=A0A8S5PBF7_9CAUD|nr:MAG TPA: hypothetical protein [Myoviridae sp. ct2cn10]
MTKRVHQVSVPLNTMLNLTKLYLFFIYNLSKLDIH